MDPAKVEAVLKWPAPRRIKELQAFLGFANFYRRFIDGFSKRAKPMTALLRKDTPWHWGASEQAAFEDLKQAFTQAPVLAMPDMSKQFTIECDASDYASGAILSQRQEDGSLHPIAYYSKSFNDAERNYEIYDKELLAIIRALDEWRHYLEGGPHSIDIVSDHKNLSYFTESRNLTRRQARWALFMSRFDFKIRYRSGVTMAQPDALSRRGDLVPEGLDNAERTLLAPERIELAAIRTGQAEAVGDSDLLAEIRSSRAYDEELVGAIERVLQGAPRMLRRGLEEWNTEDGLLLFRGKVYVPNESELRRKIVQVHHDSLPTGHPGRWKTYELVSRNYWWPGMSTFVEKYVSACDTCMWTKNSSHRCRQHKCVALGIAFYGISDQHQLSHRVLISFLLF